MRLVDDQQRVLCRYNLSETISTTALVMGFFFKTSGLKWRFVPIAEGVDGITIGGITDKIAYHLSGASSRGDETKLVVDTSPSSSSSSSSTGDTGGAGTAAEGGGGGGGCCVIL